MLGEIASFGLGSTLPGFKQVFNSLTGQSAVDAAERAAQGQQAATDRATAENTRQFDIGQQNLAPWLAAGRRGLAEQESLLGLGGDNAGAMRSLQSSPGYQFRLSQGLKGLNAGLAARGGMGSGKSIAAGTDYNQNFASNEYGNRLSQLAGISNTGQTTGNQLAGFGANYAGNQGNLWTQNANAQGAADMAGANARQSSLLGLAKLGMSAYGGGR
jgi:hypothetical protein